MTNIIRNLSSRFFVCCFFLALSCLVQAQTPTPSINRSYIVSYAPNIPISSTSNESCQQTCPVVQYLDGLGRPEETIAIGQSPLGHDIVTHTLYDICGRSYRNSLPFCLEKNTTGNTNKGAFVPESSISSKSYLCYHGDADGIPYDSRLFSYTFYENSPLNREVKDLGPGYNWNVNNKVVEHYRYSNNQSDSLKVNKYIVQSDNSLMKSGTYATGLLSVQCDIDEDRHKTWTFKDSQGRVLLTRTYSTGYHNTYYIYDEFNQLTYVLPPLASDGLTTDNLSWNAYNKNNVTYINKYGYYYRYDDQGNCIVKKLPGASPQYMVYDKLNRLVLSQDGNQRTGSSSYSNWTFYKYDPMGRLIMKGIIPLSKTLDVDDLVSSYRYSIVKETYTKNTANYGYSNSYFSSRSKLFQVSYYDNYSFLSNSGMAANCKDTINWHSNDALGARYGDTTNLVSSNGLLTGSIDFLSSSQNVKKYTAFYYDQEGRVVQKNSTSFNGGYSMDRYSYLYDFKGHIIHVRHRQKAGSKLITEGTKYEYDHAGRQTITRHYVGSEAAAIITSTNTYNELGQLATKTYGNNLETQTYTYNIRGWLKKIEGTMFSEQLYYEKDSSGINGYFNGNIKQASYKNLTGNIHVAGWKNIPGLWSTTTRTFNYTYDNLNRLRSSILKSNSNNFSESIYYDKNGNITNIIRYGIKQHNWIDPATKLIPSHVCGKIDDLATSYDGNKLLNVYDYLNDYNQLFTGGQDHKNNVAYPANYSYDSIGNMTSNLDKKIATIKYNYLNLPDTIQMQNGCMTAYNYDLSTGEKISAYSRVFIGSTVTMPVGQTLYNNNVGFDENAFNQGYGESYYDNIVYKNGVQKKILTSDGMLMNTGTGSSPVYNRQYFLKDHLGNVRVVFDENGIVKQVSNYYPLGMEYGESSEDQTEMTYQDYQFGGKEFERDFELNMYDFGARNYDATIGRWSTMDPLMELDYSVTPYNYCLNNPINKTDPTGLSTHVNSLGFTVQELEDYNYGTYMHHDLTKWNGYDDLPCYGPNITQVGDPWKLFTLMSFDGKEFNFNKNYNVSETNMNSLSAGQGGYKDVTTAFDAQIEKTMVYFSINRNWFDRHYPKRKLMKEIDKMIFFRSKVNDNAVLDIKRTAFSQANLGAKYGIYRGREFRYDDFGNYNYGVGAKYFGLTLDRALLGAGLNQISKLNPDFGNPVGYFDHSRDTEMIIRGYYHKWKK